MKKSITGFVALVLVALTVASFCVPAAYAAGKANCDAVMQELNTGKKPKQVAQDLGISVSTVYRCRRRARSHAVKPGASPTAATASPAASPAAAMH